MLAKGTVSWNPRPVEEMVNEYEVAMDGTAVGRTIGTELEVEFESDTVHSITVAAVGPYGLGPASDPVQTPPATGKVDGVKIGNLTITVSAQASAEVKVG